MSLKIGVVGASGYIGKALASYIQFRGHVVVAVGRRAPAGVRELRAADLSKPPSENLASGLDAIIHLAANTTDDSTPREAEILFAERLAVQCARLSIPLLVASSQTASTLAPSRYGRTKAAIEQAVLPHGAMVVRPGMVYGGACRGLYGTLVDLVRRLPLIPDLRPRPMVQPVHVDDLSAAMFAIVTQHELSGHTWQIAGPPLPIDMFLARIARYRLRINRLRFPVPIQLLRFLLTIATAVTGSRLSTARLDSLIQLQPLDARPDLQQLGITLRPLADGLTPRGRPTRRLLEEGRVLMSAFLGHPPDPFSTRRYALAIAQLSNGCALHMPPRLMKFPALIASLDTPAFRKNTNRSGLAWRYGVAIRILETRTQSAHEFLVRPGSRDLLRLLVAMAWAVSAELQSRLLLPWARRLAQPLE